MKILVIGSTGMLGQAVIAIGRKREIDIVGAARSMADFDVDIRDEQALSYLFAKVHPDVVINTAAIVNLKVCEENVLAAYETNARSVAFLSKLCKQYQCYLIQISTDHYYFGDGKKKHKETDAVLLLNEYARTKYAGECFAMAYAHSLIIRTNIVGQRGKRGEPTFLEWVVECLRMNKKMTVFEDFYTSSIHTKQLANIIFDLLTARLTGILNISSCDVFSKKSFIEAVAGAMGIGNLDYNIGSVHTLSGVQRGDSLGLDVSRVEQCLGYRMPTLQEVVDYVVNDCISKSIEE